MSEHVRDNIESSFRYTHGIDLSVERTVRAQADENDQKILEAYWDQSTWKFYDLYITPESEEYLVESKKG